jgi:CMP-N-acetylneuraminic acid synthetase
MTESPPSIAAFVPMRHSSERVRGKNYRPLGGKPLFHHILHALGECELVTETVVDTDSELIMEDIRSSFPDVRVIERPRELRGGHVPMTAVLTHDVSVVEADLYLQTHSTNPLLRAATITHALQSFLDCRGRHDSLFSVTPLQTRLWSRDGDPLNHDPDVLIRTQDLEPVMEENSCLYLFDKRTLLETGRRFGTTPLLFPVDRDEAWDIDEESDWRIAEALFTATEAGADR